MIDLDPSDTGTQGQIIQMWHDDTNRELLATSLKAFFEQFAQDLENNKYIIHSRHHGIVLIEDLSDDELSEIKYGK